MKVLSMHRYTDMQVAETCHGAFTGLQSATQDDFPSPPFLYLHRDLKEAAAEGVRRARAGGVLSAREHHQQWKGFMEARGWTLGPRDPEERTHPDLVDWEALPHEEQVKDRLFIAIVIALTVDT